MKALLYCEKRKPNIVKGVDNKLYISDALKSEGINKYKLNGLIIAECDFEVEEIIPESWNSNINYWYSKELLKASCLDALDLRCYLQDKNGYAIHIKNLHMTGFPKETGRYSTRTRKVVSDIICDSCTAFGFDCRKCPYGYDYQNVGYIRHMMKVYGMTIDSEYIAIPVTPEEMCRIANGEQTIIIRRTVLKEMKA